MKTAVCIAVACLMCGCEGDRRVVAVEKNVAVKTANSDARLLALEKRISTLEKQVAKHEKDIAALKTDAVGQLDLIEGLRKHVNFCIGSIGIILKDKQQ